ncbi:putative integral membrane protein [Leishmania donovani]|nr:putative integral membrane protein [Leishmania donovani]
MLSNPSTGVDSDTVWHNSASINYVHRSREDTPPTISPKCYGRRAVLWPLFNTFVKSGADGVRSSILVFSTTSAPFQSGHAFVHSLSVDGNGSSSSGGVDVTLSVANWRPDLVVYDAYAVATNNANNYLFTADPARQVTVGDFGCFLHICDIVYDAAENHRLPPIGETQALRADRIAWGTSPTVVSGPNDSHREKLSSLPLGLRMQVSTNASRHVSVSLCMPVTTSTRARGCNQSGSLLQQVSVPDSVDAAASRAGAVYSAGAGLRGMECEERPRLILRFPSDFGASASRLQRAASSFIELPQTVSRYAKLHVFVDDSVMAVYKDDGTEVLSTGATLISMMSMGSPAVSNEPQVRTNGAGFAQRCPYVANPLAPENAEGVDINLTDAEQQCTMWGLSITRVFQVYCAGAALFEVPGIVRLLSGDMPLPKAGAWVDDKNYYTDNKPLVYVFVAILACLVVSRGMACALPKSRIIIVYLVVVHTFEAGLYLYCCSHKEDAPDSEVCIMGMLMVVNISLFAARLVQLKVQHTRVEIADLKRRQEQLAIIRKKRADYAKNREEKKNK